MRDDKIEELATAMVGAYRDPQSVLSAERFADLTPTEGMAIQAEVLERLGQRVPVVKVAKLADGSGTIAPIMTSLVIDDGRSLVVPPRGFLGVEVEVAVRLGADIAIGSSPEAILAAIDGFVCGIELIGTRFDDRRNAGAGGGLADNSFTAGYVIGPVWERGTDIDGLEVEIVVDGASIYRKEGRHPFGGVLQPIEAYVRTGGDRFGGLKAGMIVTTGSLCGAVAVPLPSTVTASLSGGHQITVTLD